MDNILLNQLKNFTVLYVEDEDVIRNSIVNTLKYYFKDVIEASNGEDGYYKYLEYKPDIILCDIEMPIKDGISMVKDIRKNDISTIIIMITAYSSEEYLMQLINLNINHYITKPIYSQNLLDGILKGFGERLDEKIVFSKDLIFEMKSYCLYYRNKKINLRKRDIDFLLLLHKNNNSIVTYDLIEDKLWKDKIMSTNALKTFIKEFRHKIPIEIIQNIPKIGYKLKIL